MSLKQRMCPAHCCPIRISVPPTIHRFLSPGNIEVNTLQLPTFELLATIHFCLILYKIPGIKSTAYREIFLFPFMSIFFYAQRMRFGPCKSHNNCKTVHRQPLCALCQISNFHFRLQNRKNARQIYPPGTLTRQ